MITLLANKLQKIYYNFDSIRGLGGDSEVENSENKESTQSPKEKILKALEILKNKYTDLTRVINIDTTKYVLYFKLAKPKTFIYDENTCEFVEEKNNEPKDGGYRRI